MNAVTWRYDPALPWVAQGLLRGWLWSTATTRRRWLVAPVYVHAVVFTLALTFPQVAQAASGVAAMGVVDSYGVPLSMYTFTTDFGNASDLGAQSALATMLQMEAAAAVAIAAFGIWLLTYAISFRFVNTLVAPVAEFAQAFANQIIPGIAAIAGVVAAGIVAFNLMRGNMVRAAQQGLMAMVVTAIGAAVLHAPVTWVMSDGGPLMTGRNVAVALGSNTPANSPQAANYPEQLQGVLATQFVRRPFQQWNLSSVADDTPACAQAWSDGVLSGNQDRIKDGIAACGSPTSAAMKSSADHPSAGQLGTGGILLFAYLVFLLFCGVLSLMIIAECFRALYNAVRLLFDWATGAIPGAPQANLINTFVAVMFTGVAMFSFVTLTTFMGSAVAKVAAVGDPLTGVANVLILMILALIGAFWVSRTVKRSSAATAAGIAGSVGAGPVPERTSILKERSSAFLREAGHIGTALGAGMAGAAVVGRIPALAPGLNLASTYLPHRHNLVHMNRGAQKHQKKTTQMAKDAAREAARGDSPDVAGTTAPTGTAAGGGGTATTPLRRTLPSMPAAERPRRAQPPAPPATPPTAAGTASGHDMAPPPRGNTGSPATTTAVLPATDPARPAAAGPASSPPPPAVNRPNELSPARTPATASTAVMPALPDTPPDITAAAPSGPTQPKRGLSSADDTTPRGGGPARPVTAAAAAPPSPYEPPAPTTTSQWRPVTGSATPMPPPSTPGEPS